MDSNAIWQQTGSSVERVCRSPSTAAHRTCKEDTAQDQHNQVRRYGPRSGSRKIQGEARIDEPKILFSGAVA